MFSCGYAVITTLYLVVLVINDMSLASLVRRLEMLESVFLTFGALFETVCNVAVPRYARARMRYESDCISVMGFSGFCCLASALSAGRFWLMVEHGVDPVLGLLALARPNEIDFSVADGRSWLLFNFEDCMTLDLRAFEDAGRLTTMYPAVLVCY